MDMPIGPRTAAVPSARTDRYGFGDGRVYLTGTQALVRLLLAQRRHDRAAGLDTGGFVSGYRGSPLGGLDRELARERARLEAERIQFWPGINEDLAATAVWGTQTIGLAGDAAVEGVFALWYGKGAGLDRSGDAIRHANGAGTASLGGVLAVVGDDHGQKSSTQAYAAEPTLADLLVPVLHPASIAELIEFGLIGWGMSRYAGSWVGLKALPEHLDASAIIPAGDLPPVVRPDQDPGDVHVRWPDPWTDQERRQVFHKLEAAQAFARANRVDRLTLDGPGARLGLIAAGKSHGDLMQALQDLELGPEEAAALGLRIYKVGMPWPLDPAGLAGFADGLDEILVIEEKRPFIEVQVKELLYGRPGAPVVTGKRDRAGRWQFPWVGTLGPDDIARVLAGRLAERPGGRRLQHRLALLERQQAAAAGWRAPVHRTPYFCSGCPHSRSTRVPEGSRALAGVGCHYLAVGMERRTSTLTQMGGEGALWIGQAPFSRTGHVFANLGDGTYYHSGSLAVRACVAAKVDITFKLLFNDAVAMTGGQPVDGPLDVPALARQLRAEGVGDIQVVAEEPARHAGAALPPGVRVHGRDALDAVQDRLRRQSGVTALIFDQTCAAEKRRRRKRGLAPDPARRVVINELVCEGCGDCGTKSNCLSVVPVETEFGTKRQIDQSSCNKDFSCQDGFCPSFVTVEGGMLRPPPPLETDFVLPEPARPALERPYGILVAGIGGTGVVTIGAILGMAAHLDGVSASVLDMTGMAQKGGAVFTHIRLAAAGAALPAVRVPTGGADLLLAADLAVATEPEAMERLAGRTTAIVNLHQAVTGEFPRHPERLAPVGPLAQAIAARLGADRVRALDATELATRLFGDSIATNLFLTGYAWQLGLIPLSAAAIERAIELGGVAVASAIATFRWGRRLAVEPDQVLAAARRAAADDPLQAPAADLDEAIERRARFLADYQDGAYAGRYRALVVQARAAERLQAPGLTGFADAVARSLFKLMAYKDEYEVARLYVATGFLDRLRQRFEGPVKLSVHLAPPLLARGRPEPRKRRFGPWVFPLFRLLAAARRLRGTWFDPFGHTAERREDRRLIDDYIATIGRLTAVLDVATHAVATEIAALPQSVRGYGPVRQRALAAARAREAELLQRLETERPTMAA